MANGNGHDDVNLTKVKRCPFLNKECIGDKCALFTELKQTAGVTQQKFGTCGFSAVVLILSEINQKTPLSQAQGLQLPKGLYKR